MWQRQQHVAPPRHDPPPPPEAAKIPTSHIAAALLVHSTWQKKSEFAYTFIFNFFWLLQQSPDPLEHGRM
jgi:hypothetical protein